MTRALTVLEQENAQLRLVINNAAEDSYAKDRMIRQLATALQIARRVIDTSKLSRDQWAAIDAAIASVPFHLGGR